jgi:hypothetical protein
MPLRDDWPVLGLQSRFMDEHASKLLNDVELLQRLAEGPPTRTFTLSQLKPFLESTKSLVHKVQRQPSNMPRKRDAVHFPTEILFTILSFVQLHKKPQSDLHSCCLVSRSWCSVATALLYRAPISKGKKHLLFIRTINSSDNVHSFKSLLSKYIKTLDLSSWPRNINENVTEDLLGRLGGGLESFVAPKAKLTCVSRTNWMDTEWLNCLSG